MKTLRILSLICLLVMGFSMPMSAVPLVNARTFSDNDEGIQGRLTNVIQDKNGFVWIATFNGLIKYDGYQFHKYKSLPGQNSELQSNRINGIWENASGDLWCLSGKSMYLFKVKEERFINVQSVLNRHRAVAPDVWSVYCLDNGVTWLIGLNGECFRLQDDDPLGTCEALSYETHSYQDVSRVLLDNQGHEWIFARNGVYRYGNTECFSTLHYLMADTCARGVWMINSASRIALYDNEKAALNFYELFPPKSSSFRLSVQHNDSILFICTTQGTYQANLNTMCSQLIINDDWENVYLDKAGNYWGVRHDKSIVRYSPDGQLKTIKRPADHQYESYRIHFKEDDGLFWLLFRDTNDLLYLDQASDSFVRPAFSRSEQVARNIALHEDLQGDFWYGHEHELECLTLKNSPFEICPDLLNEEVRAITKDNKGRYWIAYRKQKVALYSAQGEYLGNLGKDGRLHRNADHIFGASIYSLKHDSQGRMWLGSKAHGLFLLENEQGSVHAPSFRVTQFLHSQDDPYSLSESSVYAIEEDDEGKIWIGSFGGGLNLYQDGKFIHYFNHLGKNESRPMVIRCLKYLGDGSLMIGSREGLFIIDTRFDMAEDVYFWHNQKRPDDMNSLADNEVMSICQTSDAQVWVSTNSGGVAKIRPCDTYLSDRLSFQNITKREGLGSEMAYSIVEDAQSNLWVVSPGNISRICHDNQEIMLYDEAYFLHSPVFSECLPLVVDNTVLFGEEKGLVSINILNIREDSYCPPLNFTDCYIDNQPAYLRLWDEKGLHFSRKERDLKLRYAAIDYQDKHHLKYAYLLEGVDKQWHETSSNELMYNNLPAGKHLLRLKSTNRYGVWMDNELQLPVNVKPTFMESIWGKLSMLLLALIIMLVVVYVSQRMYRLRHRLSIERELNDAKLRFFTDISHELRTPLSLIDGPLSEVLDDKKLSDQSRYYLEVVQKNVRRMLNLVNQILDFRKLQNKKMKYLLEHIDAESELKAIMENFIELAQHHHIDFSMETCGQEARLWVDRDKFEKIFFNLLSNAFKYTTEGKSIRLQVKQDEHTLSIAVIDQGVGIRKELIDKLFLRYETLMSQNVFKASSGIGLSLVKQFVEGHHANISVESNPGEGSCFKVTFLKGKEHFLNDENVEFYVADMAQDEDKSYQTPISVMQSEMQDEQPKLLIVEDNDELRDFMHRIFAPQYQVLLACNGQEGLRMAKEQWPDLIVTDVSMPVMDGFEMIRQIKEDADIYQIPIIVLTAKTGMDDRIGAVSMGVDDYVMKPFSANYIKVRAAALIEQRKKLHQKLMDMLSQGKNPVDYLQPNMPDMKPADEIFLQDLMAFMEQNMENSDFTIEDFASSLNMGRTTFYNKLKAATGLSPVDFVLEIRIKRAVQLLQSRNFSIAEVAYKTGFNDPKYFSRCFKKFRGESPSVFVKKL